MERAFAASEQAISERILISGDRLIVVDWRARGVCGETGVCTAVPDGEDVAAIVWIAIAGESGSRCR